MEAVNSPQHYQGKSIEAIQVIDEFKLSFCLGNVIKYILRAKSKGNYLQDLKKAKWYLEHEINQHLPIEVELPLVSEDTIESNFKEEYHG